MARRAPAFTRKQIIDGLVALGAELGRTPTKIEFLARSGTNQERIRKYFKSWNDALGVASLRPNVVKSSNASELLDDWGRVTRELGHCPQLIEYKARGTFGTHSFRRLFGTWPGVGQAFFARSGEDPQWQDVIGIIRECGGGRGGALLLMPEPAIKPLAPTTITYGEPIDFEFLRNAPVNEAGVVYLFGCLAPRLGYFVEAIQTAFPDCEAKRRDADGRLRRVRIEFEYESKNFLLHKHDVADCEVIVCWRDNWPECPLQVIELSKHLRAREKSAA